jgi:hypothetical protein
MTPLLLATMAGCRLDQAFVPEPVGSDGTDTDGPIADVVPDESDDPLVPVEACDGVDNDGDGAVDEGFPDDNGNGRADCLDPACDESACFLAPVATTCPTTSARVADPWDVVSGWSYWGPTTRADNSYTPPLAAQLDDDDGDGDIDDDDDMDVILVMFSFGTAKSWLVVLDGATGEERWSDEAFGVYSGLAVADVDADGSPDILGFDSDVVVALEADGRTKWRSKDHIAPRAEYASVTVADLYADGTPDVVADDLVLDGATGATETKLASDPDVQHHRTAVVGDVDLDGVQEIVQAGKLFSADGAERWDSGLAPYIVLTPALVQADCDPEAEILLVAQGWTLYEHDGTLVRHVPYPHDVFVGTPCIGDLDGDGASDLAVPASDLLSAWHLDGTLMWSAPIDDGSTAAGCTAYDLDGDGALEVIFAGESRLSILDGATGAVRYEEGGLSSYTAIEAPVVTDLDGDGRAEILVVQSSNGATPGVRTWRHGGEGWPVTIPRWPLSDMALDNLPDVDGRVTAGRPSWLGWNVLRGGPNDIPGGLPDVYAEITTACVADCAYGPVRVEIRVENRGTARAFDVPVALYAVDGDVRRLVGTMTIPALDRGWAMDGLAFDLSPADVGTSGFAVAANDDGTGAPSLAECIEDLPAMSTEAACP